jgi:hypothetical protein
MHTSDQLIEIEPYTGSLVAALAVQICHPSSFIIFNSDRTELSQRLVAMFCHSAMQYYKVCRRNMKDRAHCDLGAVSQEQWTCLHFAERNKSAQGLNKHRQVICSMYMGHYVCVGVRSKQRHLFPAPMITPRQSE